MTTKKTSKTAVKATKTAKAVKAIYTATPGDIDLARSAGLNGRTGETAKAAVQAAVVELHKHGAVIGDARSCPLAQAFLDKRFPQGKTVAGKPASKSTMANALNAFRAAVKSGKEYNENRHRAAKGKTGAKATGGAIVLSFPADVKDTAIVEKLDKAIKKMQESKNLALIELAAYLIDVKEDMAK